MILLVPEYHPAVNSQQLAVFIFGQLPFSNELNDKGPAKERGQAWCLVNATRENRRVHNVKNIGLL